MRNDTLVGLVAGAVLFLGGCTGEEASAPKAPSTPDAGESELRSIVYESNVEGNAEIFVINEDSSDPVNLSNDPAYDGMPRWTADGTRIIFVSNRDAGGKNEEGGGNDVYIMNADGSNVRRITTDSAGYAFPTLSSDGQMIAFDGGRNDAEYASVFVMNANGSGVTQITDTGTNEGYVSWTPDSQRIAYDTFRDGEPEIYMVNKDGTSPVSLTHFESHIGDPRLAPDGKSITFESGMKDDNSEIYVLSLDDKSLDRLTNDPGDDRSSAISHDGTRVVFASDRGREREQFVLYVVNRDGSELTRLEPTGTSNLYPDFRPPVSTGPKIAFYSDRDGKAAIYVMNADGSNQTRLSFTDGYDSLPYWSPDGSTIVFQSSKDRDSPAQLYLMNADGSNVRQITHGQYGHNSVSWSPDGKRIAFHSDRDGSGNSYVIDADGSNETQVTNRAGYSFISPTWSPDSKRIAVEGGKQDESIQTEWGEARAFQIWVFTVDGSSPPVQVTDIAAYNGYPAWSPAGPIIAFDSTQGGWADLWTVNVEDRSTVNLTNQPTQSEFAAWSSDGSKIAFVADRDGNTEIYVMNADGSDQTRLTFTEAQESAPAWSPH